MIVISIRKRDRPWSVLLSGVSQSEAIATDALKGVKGVEGRGGTSIALTGGRRGSTMR